GMKNGDAMAAPRRITVTTTPPSTSRGTRQPAPLAIPPSAQSGPPTSVEPTERPSPAWQVAMKRESDAVTKDGRPTPRRGASRMTPEHHPLATEARARAKRCRLGRSLRARHFRRAARRPDAVHPRGRGRAVLAHRRPDHRVLGGDDRADSALPGGH